ncbi:MAG: arginine--tRNA ligase [Desulfosarcinaceae bacterium]|nr:arginine--tRNA ligase [Desulfosarcinaceae bacterium]
MKAKLSALVLAAAEKAHTEGQLPATPSADILVEEPKSESHGDYATNFALVSAKQQKMAPRKIAEILQSHIGDGGGAIRKTEIAGPGFLNFFLQTAAWYPTLARIHAEDHAYGASGVGKGERVQIEFVSSNPTGPLHVGHGRGAAVGDATANIMAFCGFDVQREYYINDSGRQIHTLGRSVYLRLLASTGKSVDFPEECYQGEYIRDLAAQVLAQEGEHLLDQPEADAILTCARFAARAIIAGIRRDLERFGVHFDCWFSEQGLYDEGKVDRSLADLERQGKIYRRDGAKWFRTSDYGDEKDRVVVRSNGQTTYFASDIAYHQDKYARGFQRVIDVWGADHHGYIPRMTAAVEACGQRRDQFQVILVQLVNLLRGGEPVAMSTRAGEFETLTDVIDEVGSDAARFIFLTRHYESPLDFDLELAKQKTNDNPVYYVQYVHARIASMVRRAADNGFTRVGWDAALATHLVAPEEIRLIKLMGRYPEVVEKSALSMEPHRITFFLMELAAAFHAYYNRHRVLGDDPDLSRARLLLVTAIQMVIRNGLTLLGVSAPDRM